MNRFEPRGKKGPEKVIQEAIEAFLRARGWYCIRTHGDEMMSGLPDIFATHSSYRQRWIEVKLPEMKGSRFTAAQLERFPQMVAHGSPIWILTAATEEEYKKLFLPCNWYRFLK